MGMVSSGTIYLHQYVSSNLEYRHVRTHILEQEVTGASLVQHLDPVDHAVRYFDNIGLALGEEGIGTNVVGTDPETIKRLVRPHFDCSALHRVVVCRELALEDRWERTRGQLVGACPSTSRIGV